MKITSAPSIIFPPSTSPSEESWTLQLFPVHRLLTAKTQGLSETAEKLSARLPFREWRRKIPASVSMFKTWLESQSDAFRSLQREPRRNPFKLNCCQNNSRLAMRFREINSAKSLFCWPKNPFPAVGSRQVASQSDFNFALLIFLHGSMDLRLSDEASKKVNSSSSF